MNSTDTKDVTESMRKTCLYYLFNLFVNYVLNFTHSLIQSLTYSGPWVGTIFLSMTKKMGKT